MTLYIDGHSERYELQALCLLFFAGEGAALREGAPPDGDERFVHTRLHEEAEGLRLFVRVCLSGECREAGGSLPHMEDHIRITHAFARLLYPILCNLTGITPPWGMLTGVRPVKLFLRRLEAGMSPEAVENYFCTEQAVSREKARLACETALVQRSLPELDEKRVALYVSIPFCPTRCRYCSFVSQTIERAGHLLRPYAEKLERELQLLGERAGRAGLILESAYVGGGTPTTLDTPLLGRILAAVRKNFTFVPGAEFTVEAGRPDTFTPEKCGVMKEAGVTRVSVNPQSLCEEVLRRAGRPHTARQAEDALRMAREAGFGTLNMDLIAGLEGDTPETFAASLRQVMEWGPENITVHALSVKRSAWLAEERGTVLAHDTARESVALSCRMLMEAYRPYYLYRQKNTVGNLENTGWSLPGHESLYNVRIMDENQTILSAGAGGVTKLAAPDAAERKIQRIFHCKYPYEYISRFEGECAKLSEVEKFYGICPANVL